MKKQLSKLLSAVLIVMFMWPALPMPKAQAVSTNIVISEFRVRGPNGAADEFVELYNLSASPVNIGGWKIRGSNNAGSTSTRATITAGTILNPGCHYLVTNSSASGGPYSGSVAGDQTYATGITDDGGIALTLADDTTIVDAVGMSTGSAYKEGTPLTSLGTSNLNRGYERKPGGASGSGTDTDDNSADFQLITPSDPQNSASSCGGGDAAPNVDTTTPASGASNIALNADIIINFSEDVNVTGSWFSISCGTSGAHTATVSGISPTFTLNPDSDFATGESCTVTVFSAQVTDQDATDPPDNMTADFSWSFNTVGPPALIREIQGAAHLSPLAGQAVSSVAGIVTALRSNGFYMQDPLPDSNDATSEAIFVFTNSAPTVSVGDAVSVSGTVSEFRAGGTSSTNLTITELTSPSVSVTSNGNPLPPAIIIGTGGRIPPTTVIEDDATGDVETSGAFEPVNDGIDFYESLEAMRVQVNNAVAVSPIVDFGSNREIAVLGDNGANAIVRTTRGGIVIQATDFNPERIILNDLIVGGPTLPPVNVNDTFPGAIVGVIDYNFGNFKLEVTTLPSVVSGGLAREEATSAGTNELAIATFNVENLDANDSSAKFAELASLIVNSLKSPDIIAVEEVQDNNGPTNDSVVDATTTYNTLIAAIQAASGPTYQFRQINPVDDQDGGEPGGNIRVGFLFRTDRGLAFVDRPGGGSTTATTVVNNSGIPELSASPGRIDPTNSAFNTSRKPLAGEFTFNGATLFVIANHFNSKGGDQPLFGHFQPPTRSSEVQRHQQAQIVNDFVDAILAVDANAKIVVLGDLNDFEFSDTLNILKGGVLNVLIDTLPQAERYTYVFEGNSQALDHILLSNSLFNGPFVYDVLHVNSEFSDQVSDHDPQVVRLTMNPSAPDLTVSKANDTGGSAVTGQSWIWTLTVNNSGNAPATFSGSAIILNDNLPDSNIVYGTPTVANVTSVTGGGTIDCTIDGTNNLICLALAGSVTLGASTGSFDVQFTATASAAGAYANPRSGGACSVDVQGGVSESNEDNNTCTDTVNVTVAPTPDLTILKSHTGNFTQGQVGAQYTIKVTNSGTAPTSGTVTVVDTVPAELTATAAAGAGWVCTISPVTCTRSDALAASSSYPDITLTVNVVANAPSSVTNSAAVSGGGETNTGNNTANDPTTIETQPQTPRQQVQAVRDSLNSLLPTGDSKTDKSLQKAIDKLDQALANDLWQGDGAHLTLKGARAFHRVRDAVKELLKIKNPPATVTNAINTLVAVSRELAQTALNEAIADSGNASKIAKAQNEMNKGDQDRAKGKFANAISHYEEAWEYAQEAVGRAVIAAVDEVEPSDEPEDSEEHVHEEEAQTNHLFLPLITSNTQ